MLSVVTNKKEQTMHDKGNSHNSILESMELVRLPSPPHILGRLLDVCHDPESSMADLANLISTDAALTSKLLMAVNSAAFGITQPINNLKHALSLLGHNLVKTMAITSSIQQLFSGLSNSRSQFVCNVWLDSLYCAVFAQDIAHAIGYEHPEDAYLAGLLHDFGQIVFDAKFHQQYLDVINSETEQEAIQKENLEFGINHAELGASIIEQWPSLSPVIADAARYHHEPEEMLQGSDILCKVVAEASQIAWHWSQFGVADKNWHSQLINDEMLEKIYIQVTEKVSQTAISLGISLPDSGSLTREQLSADIEKENIQLAQKVRDNSLINVINSEDTPANFTQSPRSLLLKVAQEMQLIFSVNDVALLFSFNNPKHNKDKKQEEKYLTLYEINNFQPVGKFPINNNDSQIVECFNANKSCWIKNDIIDEKRAPISDRQIIHRMKHDSALCLPLSCENKVIGILIIGANSAQKAYLESQSGILTSYLKGIASGWVKKFNQLEKQAIDHSAEKEHEQKQLQKLVHEISNPLSVIGNYIEIMKKKTPTDEANENKEINILKEELGRIRNIISNFRLNPNAETESLFLNKELKNCIPLYVKSFSEEKNVVIKWALDENDVKVKISLDAFRQIILNLIKNAVEAQNGDAEISINSESFVNINGNNFAQFTISDRGDGVDISAREMLFSPMKSEKDGSNRGVGLTVVAEILNSFNGQIKYMENEYGGASFEVLLPIEKNVINKTE